MTRVKICGLTRLEDAHEAVSLGAWALGLILWDGSERRCSPEVAEAIGTELRRQAEIVGVFVNATLEEIALSADAFHLSMIQLHGDEGPAFAREVARRTGAKVIKAARVRDAASIQALTPFRTDFHLLDAHVEGLRGGTGQTFRWELVRLHGRNVPVILSGGLTAENVGEGIGATRPYAVDTASGTESSPGVKDPAKVKAFFRTVEQASPREAA
jgi:phosphoribosylanthranilate isomerase